MKQNSDIEDYPGKGDPWADFLHHRKRVIEVHASEGMSARDIAFVLRVDEGQVALILESLREV